MKWLIGFIAGFGLKIIEWFVKKLGINSAVMAFVIPIYIALFAFFNTALLFILLYLYKIWNTFKHVLQIAFDYSSVSGSFGGVENATITSSLLAFLHQSGLADALITSGTLFIGLLSAYFTIKVYNLIMYINTNIVKIINDLLTIMTR